MVPVTIILAQLMRHVLYKVAMSARKATAESSSHLQRYLSAVTVLRLFGREKDEAEQIHAAFRRQAHFNIREMLIQQALLPVYALVAGTGIIAVLAFGGQNVINGVWSVGSFNAFLIMFIAFSGRTRVAARVFNRWHAARAAWSRVREKIDRQDLAQNGWASGPVRAVNRLEIKDLSFGLGPEVFVKDINLTASRGQIIGVTGPVGSGKSMLATALTGLYPYSGSILIDGVEWTDLDATERYGLVAYAGHEQYLFSMSVADNITITACSPDEPDSRRLEKAAETAALMQDLDRFPQGLSTLVGDKGTKVSGGQRQRIALARAIYAQAPILILDDPFSAVDLATESRIVQGLRQDCPDRIILLFSHRLTAFRHVDHVLVLNQGKIVQSGAHAQLYQEEGMYREICQTQFFLEGEGHESR
jgi:ABC-type multidrug transport system fused ATPase/permease subunit